jgi:hypothetical protein
VKILLVSRIFRCENFISLSDFSLIVGEDRQFWQINLQYSTVSFSLIVGVVRQFLGNKVRRSLKFHIIYKFEQEENLIVT